VKLSNIGMLIAFKIVSLNITNINKRGLQISLKPRL